MDDKLPIELRTERFSLKEVFPARAKKYAQKLHRKADDIEFVRKGIPIDPGDISINDGERAAIRLITTPRLDRDSEILLPDGAILDDFRQSPSVFWSHDYHALPVGHDAWVKVEKRGILAKTLYANHQFAEDVFQCVKHGDLSSNSVGFVPVEWVGPTDKGFRAVADLLEKDYSVPHDEIAKVRRVYTKWIMLEHSDVGVASNPHALNLAVSKGELTLCDSLKHDLGLDAVGGDAIEPDATPKATLVAALEGDLTAQIETAVKEITSGESASFEEVNADTNPDEVTGSDPETKDAPVSAVGEAPSPTETAPAPDALAAAIAALSAKVDALTARLAPLAPVVEPVPAPIVDAPADFIAIDPEPDILAGLSLTPAPVAAQAPKSIETMTEAQVIEAVGKAVDALDIGKQIKELVDLSLDKLRGRVR